MQATFASVVLVERTEGLHELELPLAVQIIMYNLSSADYPCTCKSFYMVLAPAM